MVVFEDIQDVKEWLAPLEYVAFWVAVAPYSLILQDRDHCDELIASGELDTSLALRVLKGLAEMELARAFGLKDRFYHPDFMAMH